MSDLAPPEPFSCKTLELETWWERSVLKNGKPGKRWIMHHAWYTPIRTCDMCGKRGSPRKIAWRSGCYGYVAPGSPGMLCMACWNRAKPILKLQEEVRFLKYAANKIKREARKNGNDNR